MFAPESIVEDYFKNLYVGLRDGKIVKIHPSSLGTIGEGKTEILTEGKIHNDPVQSDHSNALPLGKKLTRVYVKEWKKAAKTAIVYKFHHKI